jgi:mono/diheme cytochrome c family protein
MRVLLLTALLIAAATPPPPVPSYTETQAARGRILFYENCAECHGASLAGNFGPALAGPNGNVQWESVSYVWGYMTAHMPAGNADGLKPQQYLDIMAFLIQQHGHHAGSSPLTAPAAASSKALMGQ